MGGRLRPYNGRTTASPKDHNKALRFADCAHTLCEGSDISEDAWHQVGLGLAVAIEASLHAIHDGRTDHGGIGMTRDGGRLLRRLDAEANAHWQLGMALYALDMAAHCL